MYKILLLFSLPLLLSCEAGEKKEDKTVNVTKQEVIDKPDLVRILRLVPTDFTQDLISNGTLTARQKADLKFQSSEIIRTINVRNGERVVKGQRIALLDETKLKNNLAQAKDNLKRAELELQDVLIGQGYVLRDSADIPKDVLSIAKIRSNYDQSLVNYETAQTDLNNAVLYAPFSGVIANLFSKEYNQANPSETFCTIIDDKNLEVVFNLLETELDAVRIKDKITIYPYAKNTIAIDGQIIEINPLVDKNGMVRVKASLNHTGNLYDGMNVKVLIQRKTERQLVIPKEALVLRNNREVVFTYKNGQAIWNYVETGAENSYGFVLHSPLLEGDSVIYDGNVNLAHETPVTLVK